MANDHVLYAHFGQHICGDLAGECAALFEVHVLSANFDVGALSQTQCSFQIGKRYADDDSTGLVCCDGLQSLDQCSSFLTVLVHLPVAGNNCLSQCLIHSKFLFLPTAPCESLRISICDIISLFVGSLVVASVVTSDHNAF